MLVALIAAIAMPAPLYAATPLSIELTANKTSLHMDETLELTVQTTPVVEGLGIVLDLQDNDSFIGGTMWTQSDGAASVHFVPKDSGVYLGVNHFTVDFAGDGTYGSASDSLDVTLSLYPASITVDVSRDPLGIGVQINTVDRAYVHATLTADQCVGGFAVYEHVAGGATEYLGGASMQPNFAGQGICKGAADLGYLAVGEYSLVVTYSGYPINEEFTVDPVPLVVTLIDTDTALSATPNPVEVGSTSRLTATVSTDKGLGYVEGDGSFDFYDGATLLGTVEDTGSGSAYLDVSFDALGTRTLHAVWSGTTTASPSTSPDLSLTVSGNVVHATGVGISSSTFYPVKDDYLDTLQIQGQLQEPASVDVSITSLATGSVVRNLSAPDLPIGSYALPWNGRNSAGNLVAAGSYRVRQVITDELGAELTVDKSVTVSKKELVWYSGSKTKSANDPDAKGRSGGFTFASSPVYSGGVRVKGGVGPLGSYAALGYEFKLPAAVAYKAMTFKVLGGGTRKPYMGMQDKTAGTWATGSSWVIDYFDLKVVPKDAGWTSMTGDPNANRIGRIVRGVLLAVDWSSGYYDLGKVKLTYKYALLQ
jgi:hypothetical protein